MTYLLYMKRSFTRCPRRHAVLFAVLTCAFLLPLLICIYRDSNAWGTRQYLLARSAGETYHIGNGQGPASCLSPVPRVSQGRLQRPPHPVTCSSRFPGKIWSRRSKRICGYIISPAP